MNNAAYQVAHGQTRILLVEMNPTEEEIEWIGKGRFKGGSTNFNCVEALRFKREWEQACRRLRGE